MIAHSILDCIGNTPMVVLEAFSKGQGLTQPLYAKLESFNPGGSVKDRVALSLIEDAERRGVLHPGDTLVEPTSGNTGVGLAMVAARRGYTLILTMPASMSMERRLLLAAYGAQIVLTDAAQGMAGAVQEAQRLVKERGAYMPMQFDNPANPAAHQATAQEILRDMDGRIDAFVACVGTGGTVSGVGRVLRQALPQVGIFAVEPEESPVLVGGAPAPHGIQGIGANFVPANYDAAVVDEVLHVHTRQAMEAARALARKEGILCGISSGAAAIAAARLAARPQFLGKRIVCLLPDTGERYLSTDLYKE